jgi:uncharacterized protein (DUF433 family)
MNGKRSKNMPATLTVEPRTVPLTLQEGGVWRVTGTRIPLERVIECHKAGLTPEAIVEDFDSLKLSDVYVIIGYYLDHTEEVERYLIEREEKAEEVRNMIEAGQPARPGLREELLARKARREATNGETSQ